ncbi:hypothetical protein [Thermoproteus tenax]|nr:hypothetical protein [Thermoproteus tenax]
MSHEAGKVLERLADLLKRLETVGAELDKTTEALRRAEEDLRSKFK